MFCCYSIGQLPETEFSRNSRPHRVRFHIQQFGSFTSSFQSRFCNTVCISIIIHVLSSLRVLIPFIRSNHIPDFILSCFIRFRTAHPIIGSGTNDGKSLLAKPFQILHHRIILPGCHSHIPCNMIFERTINVGYRIILVSLITTFPWIHCSFVAVHKSIMLGCVQTLITILYH